MNPSWQTFLTGRNTDPEGTRQAGFDTAILADLSHEGLIAVDGVDSRAFLQGQLSTDIDTLTPDASQLSSWSSAKGRVVAVLRLLQYDDTLLLMLPHSLQAAVMKRLSMYVLRSKVKLSDASEALVHFGLAGDNAGRLLATADLPAPEKTNTAATRDGIHIVRLHGSTPRFLLAGSASALIPAWEALSTAGAIAANEERWAWHKIQAQEPTVYPETSEHFVAQMIGLEELGAIDFKKGCYIGQEIIARAHFRGAVKRHMLRAHCETTQSIAPGSMIQSVGSEQSVAEIVDASRNPAGGQDILIVIQDERRNDELQLADGRPVAISQSN
jgi:tRNA-modifying protein YgfZ